MFDFWPGYLEIFKAEGMHYALLDMEHSAATLTQAEELCRVARLLDFPLIIRPESAVFHLMRKYLDLGPSGLMLPWIETDEQLLTARDALFTPPRGRRGPGGPSTFHNRNLNKQGWDEVEQNLFLMPQVETLPGVRNAQNTASKDWVDALMLGPYDLSLNLGVCWEAEHPELVKTITAIRDSAAKAGKPCGMVVGSPEAGRLWVERGFHFLLVSEVTAMVRHESRMFVQELEAAAAAASTAGGTPKARV